MELETFQFLKEILRSKAHTLEMEIKLDDGSIFNSSVVEIIDFGNDHIAALETSSSPMGLAFFSLSNIHHIILKPRHKNKISFHLKDLPALNKPQKLSENPSEKPEK